MRKFIFVLAAALTMCGVWSCQKNAGGGDGDVLETSWDKAVTEHPFLANFPEYEYDFQGNYYEGSGFEQFQVWDRAGTQEKYDTYVAKLNSSGFATGSNESKWEKLIGGEEYTATMNPFSAGNVIITFMVEGE